MPHIRPAEAAVPCSATCRNGQPCQVASARYTKDGQAFCGRHLPQEQCAICIDDCGSGKLRSTLLTCGHRFHSDCIGPWLASHDTCPVCRAPVAAALLDRFWAAAAPGSSSRSSSPTAPAQIGGLMFVDTALLGGALEPATAGSDASSMATLVLDFVGSEPLDISRTELETLVRHMLDRATIMVRPARAAAGAPISGRSPSAETG